MNELLKLPKEKRPEFVTMVDIDEVVMEMMRKFNGEKTWIFNTLQLYRKDRISYLKEILSDAKNKNYFIGLKLVRGAYHKQEIERADRLDYPCPVHRK